MPNGQNIKCQNITAAKRRIRVGKYYKKKKKENENRPISVSWPEEWNLLRLEETLSEKDRTETLLVR